MKPLVRVATSVCLTGLLTVFLAASAVAQTARDATLQVTVLDETRGVLPGATVTVAQPRGERGMLRISVDDLMRLYLTDSAPDLYSLQEGEAWIELRGARGQIRMNRLEKARHAFSAALAAGRSLGDIYAGYVARVHHVADPIGELSGQRGRVRAILGTVPESRAAHGYAPGKWSVKDLVGHLTDAERIFAYRLLRIARRDGDEFVVNGAQTYITSGARADFVTTAVRTGGPGYVWISREEIVRLAAEEAVSPAGADEGLERLAGARQHGVLVALVACRGVDQRHRDGADLLPSPPSPSRFVEEGPDDDLAGVGVGRGEEREEPVGLGGDDGSQAGEDGVVRVADVGHVAEQVDDAAGMDGGGVGRGPGWLGGGRGRDRERRRDRGGDQVGRSHDRPNDAAHGNLREPARQGGLR